MNREVRDYLIVMMDDIEQKIERTKAIARAACAEDEFRRYEMRTDEVLVHVANAKAHVLAANVDVDP